MWVIHRLGGNDQEIARKNHKKERGRIAPLQIFTQTKAISQIILTVPKLTGPLG